MSDQHYYLIKVNVDELTIRSVHENEEEEDAPIIFKRELVKERDEVIAVTTEARIMADSNGWARIVL